MTTTERRGRPKKNLNTFGDGNASKFILEKTIEFLNNKNMI